MTTHLPRILLALLLTPLGLAQAHAQESADSKSKATRADQIHAAWQSFRDRSTRLTSDGGFRAEWSAAAGTPRAIFGEGLRLRPGGITSAAQARSQALQILRDHRVLLGSGSTTFVESAYMKIRQTHVLVFDQHFRGLLVLDGRADVRLHEVGVCSMFGAEAFEVPIGFAIDPRIDASDAIELAHAHLDVDLDLDAKGDGVTKPTAQLLIWADRRCESTCRVHLAWEVAIASSTMTGALKSGKVYVDARDESILQFREDIHGWQRQLADHKNGSRQLTRRLSSGLSSPHSNPAMMRAAVTGTVRAWVDTSITGKGALSNVPLHGIRVTVQGGGSGFTDAQGRFSIAHSGTTAVKVSVSFASGLHVGTMSAGSGTAMSVSKTLTPGVASTIQIYSSTATETDRSQSTAYYLVDRVHEFVRQKHILNNHKNLANLNKVSVSVNGSQACQAYYNMNSITFGKSSSTCPNMAFSTVVEHEWGHGLDDVFGGISRAGGMGEGWADVVTTYYTGQPIIGKDFQGAGKHVRDATNTRAYPSGNSPHQKGEAWMGACWKLRVALVKKLGSAAGSRHAETIVLGSLIANASTEPAALREIFLLDDNDGNLNNGTPNCRELVAAFTTTHKIPSPVKSCSATPGSFTTYGTGCAGTGKTPASCMTQNSAGGSLVVPPPPGTDIAYVAVAKNAMSITAIELYTKAVTGTSQKATISIYRDSSGGPATSAAASATLTAGAAGWYKAKFSTAVTVKSKEKFYIVHNGDKVAVALLTKGTAPAAAATLTRNPIFTMGKWLGLPPQIADRPAWKIECSGGGSSKAIPVLSSNSLPEIGYPFSVQLSRGKANAPATLYIGVSNQLWSGLKLPFDLARFGAKGCLALTSMDLTVGARTNVMGNLTQTFNVPNVKAFVGITVYFQYAVTDPLANGLGLAVSNAAAVKIGTR